MSIAIYGYDGCSQFANYGYASPCEQKTTRRSKTKVITETRILSISVIYRFLPYYLHTFWLVTNYIPYRILHNIRQLTDNFTLFKPLKLNIKTRLNPISRLIFDNIAYLNGIKPLEAYFDNMINPIKPTGFQLVDSFQPKKDNRRLISILTYFLLSRKKE